MCKLFLVAAVLLVTAGLGADTWSADYYLVSANHNQIVVMDHDAIKTETTGFARAPFVSIRRASDTGGFSFAYAVIDSEFDCRGHQVATISITLFGGDGQATTQQPPDIAKPFWTGVKPLTQADDALAFVCDKTKDFAAQGFFRFQGLSLGQIVGGMFDGPWPYDEVQHP